MVLKELSRHQGKKYEKDLGSRSVIFPISCKRKPHQPDRHGPHYQAPVQGERRDPDNTSIPSRSVPNVDFLPSHSMCLTAHALILSDDYS